EKKRSQIYLATSHWPLLGSVGNGRPLSLRGRDAVGSNPTWATNGASSQWSVAKKSMTTNLPITDYGLLTTDKCCPSGPAVVAATLSRWRSWVRIPPRIVASGQWLVASE